MFKNGKLRCPNCKNDDLQSISHFEYVVAQRRISKIKNGVLIVEGTAEYDDEDSTGPRLFCSECCQEFSIPLKLDIEFV